MEGAEKERPKGRETETETAERTYRRTEGQSKEEGWKRGCVSFALHFLQLAFSVALVNFSLQTAKYLTTYE